MNQKPYSHCLAEQGLIQKNFGQKNGLSRFADERCQICSLYIAEGNSFIMSNNMKENHTQMLLPHQSVW